MTSTSKPELSKIVWYGSVEGQSPSVTPDPSSPHMAFNCVAATNASGNTTALYAGYNLGWPYLDLYGGQLPAPINLVATNLFTGDTYISPCKYSTNSVYLSIDLFRTDSELATGPASKNRSFENAWFNADLPVLLSLPPDGGSYGVSLWLDDVITPIASVDVPQNSARRTPATTEEQVVSSSLVSIQSSADDPNAEPGVIRMDGPIPTGGNRIYATLPGDVFTSPPMPVDGSTPVLTLMGFLQSSRRFFWYKDTDFYASAKQANCTNFNFDPFALVPHPSPAENIFIVSQLGTIRSEALWIPANQSVAP